MPNMTKIIIERKNKNILVNYQGNELDLMKITIFALIDDEDLRSIVRESLIAAETIVNTAKKRID